MNLWRETDSSFALDRAQVNFHSAHMNIPAPLLLYRQDPARNMARFYRLSIEPTLFGEIALVRAWGRIGTKGRQLLEFHDDALRAQEAFEKLARRKERRGYTACRR